MMLMNARQTKSSLKVNEFQEINVVGSIFSKFNLWTVGTIGDGSCFLHSILYAVDEEYRRKTRNDRFKMMSDVRKDLAKLFTKTVYQQLSKGNIAELGKDNKAFSYEVLKAGLLDYNYWFGLEFLQFVSDSLNLNIMFAWWRNNKLQIYQHARSNDILFIPGRNTIVLYWVRQNHFQPIGQKIYTEKGTSVKFSFSDDDPFIKLFL